MQALIGWSYYPYAEMELEWLSLKSWEKWVGANCKFQNRSQFDFKMIWILGPKALTVWEHEWWTMGKGFDDKEASAWIQATWFQR
jgi:hypothetical protein